MERKKFKREDAIELTEANVIKIFQECKATASTSKEDLLSIKFINNPNIPMITFDFEKLQSYKEKLKYMFGQLYFTHRYRKDKLDFKLSTGCLNYKGQTWTKDQNILFALYYLANATQIIQQFHRNNLTYLCDEYNTIPTLSLNDPNFKEWSRIFVQQ